MSINFDVLQKKLRDLVHDFYSGAILLPQFQRDYIWKSAKIRNLLDSLYRGFPIGGFYLWRPKPGTSRGAKSKAFNETDIKAPFVGYLIDGQQRLTSLEAAFALFSENEDKGCPELRCFLDLAAPDEQSGRVTRLFVSYGGSKSITYRADNDDPTLVSIEKLFNGHDAQLRKDTEESLRLEGWDTGFVHKALTRFDRACEMLNQLVPCTTVYDVEDKDAIEVFNRLNKGGTTLRQSDVRAAELAQDRASVEVLNQMREFVAQDRPQRLGFGFSFAFRTLVVFHRGRAQLIRLKPNWVNTEGPHGRTLAQSWHAAEKAISKALEFADQKMGWSRRALLPSANALIVLASAVDKAEFKIDRETEQLYRRWLCLTALRGVFRGSVETTIERFVKPIRDSKQRPAEILVESLKRAERHRVRADEFLSPAQTWGPATQVMLAYFVAQEAKDWLSGDTIDALARCGDGHMRGDLSVHHLFPRNLLSELVENPNDANRPANFALLSVPTNAEFSDKPPDDVWTDLEPPDERKRAAVQFFGDAAGDKLRADRYDEFCQWRADRLAESINDWLGM